MLLNGGQPMQMGAMIAAPLNDMQLTGLMAAIISAGNQSLDSVEAVDKAHDLIARSIIQAGNLGRRIKALQEPEGT